MASIDAEALLQPVSPDQPCGEDLSYDPVYLDLERAAAGTQEQQVGDSVLEAQEPDWREVRELCLQLLSRSKDLRVAMHLTLALLQTDGVQGLRDGLALTRGLLERYWEGLHPQLDPVDDYDPLERINIISSLSPLPGSYSDPMAFRQRLREVPLTDSRMGRFMLWLIPIVVALAAVITVVVLLASGSPDRGPDGGASSPPPPRFSDDDQRSPR